MSWSFLAVTRMGVAGASLLALAACASSPVSRLETLHVAPDAPSAAACAPADPCSLERAIERAGAAVAGGRSVEVQLAGGVYARGDLGPVQLAPGRGTGDLASGASVRYRAAPGAPAVLSGGVPLPGGWAEADGGALVYCADGQGGRRAGLPNVHARQMFIGDVVGAQRRAVLAKAEIAGIAGDSHDAGFRLDTARGEIVGPKGGLSPEAIAEVNAAAEPTPLKFRFSFLASMAPIDRVDQSGDGLRLVPTEEVRSLIRGFYGELFGDGGNFNFAGARLEGLRSALDEPGEFLIETGGEACAGAAAIRYRPFDGDERDALRAGRAFVTLPVLETVLRIEGDARTPPDTRPAANVTLEGLVFAHTTFNPVVVRPGEDRFPAHFELERGSFLRPKNDARGEADPESVRNLVWVMPPSRLFVSEGVPTSAAYQYPGKRPFALLYAERERLREGWLPPAVLVRHSEGVALVGNTFAHTGAAGVAYDGGARRVSIRGNRFIDLGGTAVRVGGVTPLDRHPYCPPGAWPKPTDPTIRFGEPGGDQPFFPGAGCDAPQTPETIGRTSPFHNAEIEIRHNRLERIGRDFEGSVGINVTYATGAVIAENDLIDLSYTGITVGHGFGYFDGAELITSAFGDLRQPPLGYDLRLWRRQHATIAGGHRVERNYILRPLSLLEDGGGIYLNSDQNGTILEGNYIEMTPLPIPRRGLYLDEGASRITARDNVVLGALSGVLLSQTDKSEAIIGNVVERLYADRQGEAPPDGYHAYDPAGASQAAHRQIPAGSDAWLRNDTNALEPTRLIDKERLPPEAERIRDRAGARGAFGLPPVR